MASLPEKILTPNPARFALTPNVEHQDILGLLEKMKIKKWIANEIDFTQDQHDYQFKLTDDERHFIKMITAFFASSDGLVMENLNCNFMSEVQIPEARQFFAYQIYNESEHSQTYANMLVAIVPDAKEQQYLFQAIETIPSIKKLADWAKSWMDQSAHPFCVRIIAFVLYEGLVFSGKFAAIFWFVKKNLLPGFRHANLLISVDEGGHESQGILLHQKLENKCPETLVHAMIQAIVDLDIEFMTESIPVTLIGMNIELMTEYIKTVANRILKRLGYVTLYQVNPNNSLIYMMDKLALDSKTSFFELRNDNYEDSSVINQDSEFNAHTEF